VEDDGKEIEEELDGDDDEGVKVEALLLMKSRRNGTWERTETLE
jgi:hypothetical protein